MAPFGVSNGRVLIITPGLVTKDSIKKSIDILQDNFLTRFDVLFSAKDLPVLCEFTSDISDDNLKSCHIVYSNQLVIKVGNLQIPKQNIGII